MRQEADFFEGKEPVLVYIAKRLNEALRLEAIFSNAGVDYGVEADEYKRRVHFPARAHGGVLLCSAGYGGVGAEDSGGKRLPAGGAGGDLVACTGMGFARGLWGGI